MNNKKGIVHLIPLLLVAAIVVITGVLITWWVLSSEKGSTPETTLNLERCGESKYYSFGCSSSSSVLSVHDNYHIIFSKSSDKKACEEHIEQHSTLQSTSEDDSPCEILNSTHLLTTPVIRAEDELSSYDKLSSKSIFTTYVNSAATTWEVVIENYIPYNGEQRTSPGELISTISFTGISPKPIEWLVTNQDGIEITHPSSLDVVQTTDGFRIDNMGSVSIFNRSSTSLNEITDTMTSSGNSTSQHSLLDRVVANSLVRSINLYDVNESLSKSAEIVVGPNSYYLIEGNGRSDYQNNKLSDYFIRFSDIANSAIVSQPGTVYTNGNDGYELSLPGGFIVTEGANVNISHQEYAEEGPGIRVYTVSDREFSSLREFAIDYRDTVNEASEDGLIPKVSSIKELAIKDYETLFFLLGTEQLFDTNGNTVDDAEGDYLVVMLQSGNKYLAFIVPDNDIHTDIMYSFSPLTAN